MQIVNPAEASTYKCISILRIGWGWGYDTNSRFGAHFKTKRVLNREFIPDHQHRPVRTWRSFSSAAFFFFAEVTCCKTTGTLLSSSQMSSLTLLTSQTTRNSISRRPLMNGMRRMASTTLAADFPCGTEQFSMSQNTAEVQMKTY